MPGSKSLTNRLLVLAALAEGPGTLRGALRARDTNLMIAALRHLGTEITSDRQEPSTLRISPGPIRGATHLECGLAGTVMRFLPPIAALGASPVRFDGDAAARVRPMAPLLDALRALGVKVLADDGSAAKSLPFVVRGPVGGVVGGEVALDASASSQFVSALLLAAPRFERGLRVRNVGSALPSLPHVEMTVANLRDAGVRVDDATPGVWEVAPGPIAARDVRVEPDLSNAAPFLAAALVAGGEVTVPGWPMDTKQPGALVPQLLEQLGARVCHQPDGDLKVCGTGEINGLEVDLHAAGELAPTMAALAALASGPSRLRGIAHLRGHETDRLAALAAELTGLGALVEQTPDGLAITPRPLHGGVFRTYHDHRLATSGALVGLRIPGVVVENVETTSKTLPGFVEMWRQMLAGRP